MLVLALLVSLGSETQHASVDWFQCIWSALRRWLGLAQLARLPCLYASVNHLASLLGHRLFVWQACSFRAIQAACLTIQPASKPFGQLSKQFSLGSKWTMSLCIIESGPTILKTGWPVYKPVACLQTGQVCNHFTTYTCRMNDNCSKTSLEPYKVNDIH